LLDQNDTNFGENGEVLQQILPFILVGIGIDDAFVISGAFDATDPSLGFRERMEKASQRVGVSITLTKVTSLAAFLLGATCAFPSVQYFCYYASTSVSWCVGKVWKGDF
jgi:predicted RND superfamily exporter protein